MNKALRLASKSLARNEVPVGALIIDSTGIVLAKAYNLTEKKGCQTKHAEIIAIEKACKKIGGWRLSGCSIYVTLEPCLMCFGLIKLSRISTLIYAATSTLFGYNQAIISKDCYLGELTVISGLKQDASLAMLKKFFKQARMRKRDNDMKKERDYAAIREILFKKRVELQRSSLERSEFSEDTGDVKDVADEAYLVSSQKLQRAIGETDFSEIKMIDQALSRIEEGGYGICIDCNGEISEARLDYYPYAIRCIVCQEEKTS
jgi:tRNA(adenine34) deaminase